MAGAIYQEHFPSSRAHVFILNFCLTGWPGCRPHGIIRPTATARTDSGDRLSAAAECKHNSSRYTDLSRYMFAKRPLPHMRCQSLTWENFTIEIMFSDSCHQGWTGTKKQPWTLTRPGPQQSVCRNSTTTPSTGVLM